VGLSSNVVDASWQALVDSIEYKLHKDNVKPRGNTASRHNGAKPRSGRVSGTSQEARNGRA
jgi:hypothetical protein